MKFEHHESEVSQLGRVWWKQHCLNPSRGGYPPAHRIRCYRLCSTLPKMLLLFG